jgi:hypothetical protein
MNFKKPERWQDLPTALMMDFAETVELDYDTYEGSSADELSSIKNNPNGYQYPESRNNILLNEAYEELSQKTLTLMANNCLSRLKRDISSIEAGFYE